MAGAKGMMAMTATMKATKAGIKASRESNAIMKLSQSRGKPPSSPPPPGPPPGGGYAEILSYNS